MALQRDAQETAISQAAYILGQRIFVNTAEHSFGNSLVKSSTEGFTRCLATPCGVRLLKEVRGDSSTAGHLLSIAFPTCRRLLGRRVLG